MSFQLNIRRSRFILSCIFLTYTVYALYYYLTSRSPLGIALLSLIGTAFLLSLFITFVSYRINLKNKPRPKLHRFIKMAKYFVQIICSAISIGFIFSAVHTETTFSLVMAIVSLPFLLWSLFVNVIVELYERKISKAIQRKKFVAVVPRDSMGEPIDVDRAIAEADGLRDFKAEKLNRANRPR